SNLDRTNLGYRDTNLSLLGLVDVVLTVGHCLLELSHTHLAVRQSNKESVQLVNLRNESPRRRVGRDYVVIDGLRTVVHLVLAFVVEDKGHLEHWVASLGLTEPCARDLCSVHAWGRGWAL